MPYVRVNEEIWIDPDQVFDSSSLKEIQTFLKAARAAVDLLFDAGYAADAQALMRLGSPMPRIFGLGEKIWPLLPADEAYRKWVAGRKVAA